MNTRPEMQAVNDPWLFWRRPYEPLYHVKIINNAVNTDEEVMLICMAALDCDEQKGYAIAAAVAHDGACVVARAPYHEAEEIADVIRAIGLKVFVIPASPAEAS